MRWANFLHFYQPAEQQPDILEAIINQSYRPLFDGFLNLPKLRLTVNITGSLLELFDKYGHNDLIDKLRLLIERGNIEFTSSAKYHALLPFLNEAETIRQIKLNDETNRFYLGAAYKPKGFFPPEMAYNKKLGEIIAGLGFEWLILDEIAAKGVMGVVDYNNIYQIKETKLKVFFRERRLSNLIMSAIVRSSKTLSEAMKDDLKSDRFVLTAMDGETFGHHRPGLQETLLEFFDTPDFNFVTISDLLADYELGEEVEPVSSTWASSAEDIEKNAAFLSWSDPENILHKLQWEFTNLVLAEVNQADSNLPVYETIRKKMDVALASDHFWWASAKPWWSLEMIEAGAYQLLDTIRNIPDLDLHKLEMARDLYEKIITIAFDWQRTGRIRKIAKEKESLLRIPFKERTLEQGGSETGVYFAFLEMMKKLEKEATERGEYEGAILWRDAVYKLENKMDIYDTLSAVDLLRIKIPFEEIEKTIQKYKEKYNQIRGGQPDQRSN